MIRRFLSLLMVCVLILFVSHATFTAYGFPYSLLVVVPVSLLIGYGAGTLEHYYRRD